ncbi:MAG: DNA polymerase III subunit alpha [Anaerolineae bacterium]
MAAEFVHLHVHSEFSLLDGLGRVNDLVKQAASLGQRAMALTDHGTMHGVIDFFRACKRDGIKPIVGVEAYLTKHGRPMEGRDATLDKARHHLLLLAENEIGYRNLLKVCTHAQLEGYYYRPRIDKAFLEEHAQGLICTSGCLASEIPTLLNQGRENDAVERVQWYRDIFGPGRYYLELQEHSIPELDKVNRQLIEFSRQYDLPLLATNDVHYVKSRDATPHDVLLCIQTTAAMTAKERLRMSDGSYYVRSAQEMDQIFGAYPGALSNSLLIADMCNVDVEDKNYHLPPFPVPPDHDYQSYLRHLAENGLRQRYGSRVNDPAVRQRCEHELKVIHEMGFDVYFLIVGDLCRYARERGIWYNVRGSGAGSVIAYVTGITNLDPLPNNLIFERFLNPGRVSMPDFDLDFPDDQREEMIRYTIARYGEDQVAQIVTFGRLKARAAVRDVGRVMEIPLSAVDRVAKMIPNIPGKPVSIREALEQIPDLKQTYDEQAQVKELLETASLIEGVARHASTHAAAVIIADRPLIHYTPLMRPQKSAITKMVTQYEFPVLESIGLLKVDFLGLSTLSVMREATRLIAERHGTRFTLDNIPLDDVESYKLLAGGEVAGVFQVEGAGMRRVLTEMQPHEFNNIVAAISLYRPGPMDFIPEYIACLHGRKKPEYVHPALEPILGETYGVCIYQEQIIQLLTLVAGYTAGEADLVRRAISKKKADVIEKERAKFAQGSARTSGLTREEADKIWDALEGFARYGFNRAHAADYAVICVQTAYLKAHYPLEFMAAQLLVERDKSDKVTNFITECRRMGIEVLSPTLNASGLDFTIEQRPANTPPPIGHDAHMAYRFPIPPGAAIRFGLAAVKNVGEGPVEVILAARRAGGAFRSLEDLCQRVDLRKMTRRPLECLIKVGALDDFGERAQMLAAIEGMMGESAAAHEAKDVGQMSIFDLFGGKDSSARGALTKIRLPKVEAAKPREQLTWEKELLGVYASSHPLQQITVDVSDLVTCQCGAVDTTRAGQSLLLIGMLTEIKQIVTKKGEPMGFCTLEDLGGSVELTIFPRTYAEVRERLALEKVVLVRGKVDARDGSRVSILVDVLQDYVDRAKILQDGMPVRPPSQASRAISLPGNGKVYDAQFGPGRPSAAAPALAAKPGGGGPMAGAWYNFGGEGSDDDEEDALAPLLTDDDDEEAETTWQPAAESPGALGTLYAQAATASAPVLADGGRAQAVYVAASAANDHPPANGAPAPIAASTLFELARDPAHGATAAPHDPPAPRPRTLHITMPPSANAEEDKRRLTQIYDLMRQHRDAQSRDRFVVYLTQSARRLMLDFPNDPVTCNHALQATLAGLVGWESVRVEATAAAE